MGTRHLGVSCLKLFPSLNPLIQYIVIIMKQIRFNSFSDAYSGRQYPYSRIPIAEDLLLQHHSSDFDFLLK